MYLLTLLLIGGAACMPYDGCYMPCQASYPCQNYYVPDYYRQPLYVIQSDNLPKKEEPEIPSDTRPMEPSTPRKKNKRVLTSIFAIPGALADSFLSGEISL